MLELQHINKKYQTGDLVQVALDDVSLNLRDNEFVSILGPSGSGKTTLLNIIGGLDRYDSGDLIINGTSTKRYKDRDWDTYRNHTIGFVFQSYNLIPHQTILGNVELALTIAGVSPSERRQRAKNALIEVGLDKQFHKRPSQLSGGQMQRVAIARALVNDPDILLADEPTGALDSETSVQVMELLKKVAQNRLVVMVTHNSELAEEYSTRIVRLKDGHITADSDPFMPQTSAESASEQTRRAKMSFLTSLSLSFNNLKTKKARTLLTAFAGSIGIIGIALILALSTGVNNYIEDIQKETMTSYPITIEAQTMDLSGLLGMENTFQSRFEEAASEEIPENTLVSSAMALESTQLMASSLTENDLTAFKAYLDDPESEIQPFIGENGVVYSYNVSFDVYSRNADGKLVRTDADPDDSASQSSGIGSMMSQMRGGMSAWNRSSAAQHFSQMTAGQGDNVVSSVITDNYDLVYGSWPEKYDELILVLNESNRMEIGTLYQLGLITGDQYKAIEAAIENEEDYDPIELPFEEICAHPFLLIPSCDHYAENEDGTFSEMDSVLDEEQLLEKAIELKITGIVHSSSDKPNLSMTTNIGYTSLLTDYLIDHANESAVILAQEADPETDVLTGMHFTAADDATKVEDAKAAISAMGVSEKAQLYQLLLYYGAIEMPGAAGMTGVDPSALVAGAAGMTGVDPSALAAGAAGMTAVDPSALAAGAAGMTAVDPSALAAGAAGTTAVDPSALAAAAAGMTAVDPSALAAGAAGMTAAGEGTDPAGLMGGDQESMMAMLLEQWLADSPDEEVLISFYDESLAGSSLEDNLQAFGKVSYDAPNSISIYTDSFENKDRVSECIEHYNENASDETKITYTDYVALLTSSLTSIVNAISYVLIAFVAVSLVVSCIMIGIITHISVLERTKEIGILRALGASKRNISQVFNAETVIIGFCSGLLGVLISTLLTYPINSILRAVLDNQRIHAELPISSSVILVIISVIITVIGGLIPAKKAAQKDPVIALRTE